LTACHGSSIVTREVAVVRDATVIDKPLSTGEVIAAAVQTDQLDEHTI
jgi:hypothetical protein